MGCPHRMVYFEALPPKPCRQKLMGQVDEAPAQPEGTSSKTLQMEERLAQSSECECE